MSNKSNQPPPQRTQTENHDLEPSSNIDHVPHGLVAEAVRRYNNLANATSSIPSSSTIASEDFDKKEDNDEDILPSDRSSQVCSRLYSSTESLDQVDVANKLEINPNDTDDTYNGDNTDSTDDSTFSNSPSDDSENDTDSASPSKGNENDTDSASPSEDSENDTGSASPSENSENDTDSAHNEKAPKPIIAEKPKTVATIVEEFDNNLYAVRDDPNTHQQIHSQMMSKTIEDLPNEMINKIFHYLDESDVIHTGLAYKRLSRYKVVGDKIGRKYYIFMPLFQH